MSRILIILGCLLLFAGLAWPLIGKLGLGHLPGDITIRGERFRFYFPLATSLLVSIVLTLILWLFRR